MLIPIQQLEHKLPRTDFHTNESRPEVEWHALFHSRSRSFLIVCFCVCLGRKQGMGRVSCHTHTRNPLGESNLMGEYVNGMRVKCLRILWPPTQPFWHIWWSGETHIRRTVRFKFVLNRTFFSSGSYKRVSTVGDCVNISHTLLKHFRFSLWVNSLLQ